jgi:MSHA biogenesis protein MshL
VRRAEHRFDLVFNNAPLHQVFAALAAGSNYSFVLPPGLTGSVAVNLKNVTATDALEVLREMYGFEYRVSGSRVYVQTSTIQMRMYQVAYPSAKRIGSSDTRITSGSITNAVPAASGGGTSGSNRSTVSGDGTEVSTTTNADFWKELEIALKAIVGVEGGRQVVVSQHSGMVVVRALPKELREVEEFLRSSRLSIERQVMLEAKVVEVTLGRGYESGINWASLNAAGNHRISVGANAARINVPGSIGRAYGIKDGSISTTVDNSGSSATVTPTTLGQLLTSPATAGSGGLLGMAFSTNNFYGLLSFLESQGAVHVLSSPRVAAINNQKAVLRVGTDDFYITNISTTVTTSASGNVTTPSISVQPFFSGISLDVTPQIDTDGMVTMHVRPSVSTVTEKSRLLNLGTLGNFVLPLASSNVNETDTVVRVPDGNIVAIGGLMQQDQSDSSSEVPLLGRIPILGNLFKRTSRSLEKRELVFLIRATVIKNDADWRSDLVQTESRIRDMELPKRTVREQFLGE